ncbi:nucleotidyltransferase domain-containing protein [Paraburkholderia phenoliruptrix]|uniref:nucleotidyltransferase domain-containing protein n=1 Tax=Paraburkholderia phenoliruptrix TaxID=252970 RepID=UPI003D977EAF
MSTHFYAFGSICRGELDRSSDVDLLACSSDRKSTVDPQKFSIYTYDRLRELWHEGNPFAWHLHFESALIFSPDGTDFIKDLGAPARYGNAVNDCKKFQRLFEESAEALGSSSNSEIFHISCIFLAVRNFATCYSFLTGKPVFSRKSPILINPALPLNEEQFEIFSRARILSTRGYGEKLSESDVQTAKQCLKGIDSWMKSFDLKEQHE